MAKKKAPVKKAAAKSKKSAKSTSKRPAGKRSAASPPVQTSPADAFAANPGGRNFAELKPVSDGPWDANTTKQFYNSPFYDKTALTSVPPLNHGASGVMELADVIGKDSVNQIAANGKIVFHSVGDTGAMTVTGLDTEEEPIGNMMAKEVNDPNVANRASFFFHLGDVIYQFGDEAAFYYEQFYEPYRTYNAPIFAIPGNHDGMTHQSNGEQALVPFLNNFCSLNPGKSPDANGLIRDTMTQPGVYFTLDAPFVSIIGLYTNVFDGVPGGVISSCNGKYPNVSDVQLGFLKSQLTRLQALRNAGNKLAIILAVHHPPFAGAGGKGGSPLMLNDLLPIFTSTGVWPDAILSGHTHHYERFTYNANGREIPCLVAGCGGYNMKPIIPAPKPDNKSKVPVGGHVMRGYFPAYGYLKVSVSAQKLGIAFNSPNSAYGIGADTVVVDLSTHKVIKEGKGNPDTLV